MDHETNGNFRKRTDVQGATTTGVLCEKTGVSGEKNMQNTAVSIKKCAKPFT